MYISHNQKKLAAAAASYHASWCVWCASLASHTSHTYKLYCCCQSFSFTDCQQSEQTSGQTQSRLIKESQFIEICNHQNSESLVRIFFPLHTMYCLFGERAFDDNQRTFWLTVRARGIWFVITFFHSLTHYSLVLCIFKCSNSEKAILMKLAKNKVK